mmetsp:Transcript_19001/g.21167  ORF Transcript_19001/g.21167 Transcript_19001/m.21167 type:complete len:424 (+) Transcript_19001:26-1297(+)
MEKSADEEIILNSSNGRDSSVLWSPVPARTVEVTIPSATLSEEDSKDKHTQYVIQIKDKASGHIIKSVKRRFKEFIELHSALRQKYAHVRLPDPPKKTRKLLDDKNSPSLVKGRQQELLKYIRSIQNLPTQWESIHVQLFLRLMDITGKVFVITGASHGIGLATAQVIADLGGHTIFACRSKEKVQPLLDDLRMKCDNDKIEFMELDLADMASIRNFATNFLQKGINLDVLINNAAIAMEPGLTKDGFQLTLGTNYIGHFLLTSLLLENLLAGSPSRVINIGCGIHMGADLVALETVREEATGMINLYKAFRTSKLANAMFTKELAKRNRDNALSAFCVNPGVASSGLLRKLPNWINWGLQKMLKTPEECTKTILFCALSRDVTVYSGRYFEEMRVSKYSTKLDDDTAVSQLWEASARWINPN